MNLLWTHNLKCDINVSPPSAIDQLVEQPDSCFCNLMDKHTPIRTTIFTEKPFTPWYKTNSREQKSGLQIKTELGLHKDIYTEKLDR